MRTHTVSVVDTKEVTDEHVAYLLRCCDDPTTDSWHTMLCVPSVDDKRTHQQQIDELATIVSAKHEAKLAWRGNKPSMTMQRVL